MRNALKFLAILTAITVPLVAEGSDTKGKYYFKKSCKSCHVAGVEAIFTSSFDCR